MNALVIVLIVILVLVVGVVLWTISAYNRLVRAKNLVEQSWNQIDVELNRRYDLIPNLVNTIKGATNYEQSTLESVVALRNQAAALAGAKADPAQRAQVEAQLSSQLQSLVAVTVEAYPNLQANANFMQLQNELSEIESRIANARKYYNANVGSYNTTIESFPYSILAGGRFAKADYFQIQDSAVRQAPVVDFGTTPGAPAPAAYPALPQQMSTPFAGPAGGPPAADAQYAQPDFTTPSRVQDQR
ncbi:MAG: LemA family protein [Propionibacteriaceae bacterium]|jgi:LemA protein|nr:LemA family protein [Propionibacteriaceae bacterium]